MYNTEELSKLSWIDMFSIINADKGKLSYISAVPYQIKKIAVKDCYIALRTNKKKTKQTGVPFSLKFRSKKNPIQSCYIPKSAVKESGIYPTIAGKLKYTERSWFLGEDIADCRLVLENGRWFLIIPKKVKIQPVETQDSVVGIDLGVRNFVSYFSTCGRFGRLGIRSFDRILKLNLKIDRLLSKIATEKDKNKKRNLKRSVSRTRFKIKDLVDDLHNKVIKFITSRFGVVIVPPFNVKSLTSKRKRNIRKSVVRSMLSFRFYEFRERLRQKCASLNIVYLENTEAWTSKTNTFDGTLIPNLGSKEYFKHDNILIHRDINGARNILLRAMRDTAACS